MKIAMLAHCHHPISQPFAGGLEMHTAMVADELTARGHHVVLFAKAGSRTRAELRPIIEAGFRFGQMYDEHGVDRSQEIIDSAVIRAIAAIDRESFDVVFNNSLEPQPYEFMHHHPMFTVLHTPPTLERVNAIVEVPGWQSGPLHEFAGVSATTSRQWAAQLPQVSCILNGIDLQHWAPRHRSAPTPDLAVWAARIAPEKGLTIAIKAAELAGLRLAIGGPISNQRYFDAEIAPLLGERAFHVGHLDHTALPAFLQRGSVFLSTPRWEEPFGLAMVEAMAAGTPVAALPMGAAAEIISPSAGVLALDSTAAALASAAQQALTLDRESVRRSADRFDKRLMVDAYEQVLRSLNHAYEFSRG